MKPTDERRVRADSPEGGHPACASGNLRDDALHRQLYRYAEDLQYMMERHDALEAKYEALRESFIRLGDSQSILDGIVIISNDLHITTDEAGRILQSNPAAATLAETGELVGSALHDWVLPEFREAFDALLHSDLDTVGTAGQHELQLCCKNSVRPARVVSAQVLAAHSADGQRKLHWVLRDITERRGIEFETQVSSLVFNNSTEAAMIVDAEGEIRAVNPAFCRITGYSPQEAVGRRPSMFKFGLQDEEFYFDMWSNLRETGSWQGEIYSRRKNGEVCAEWLTITAARDSAGKILSYIAIFKDLSRVLSGGQGTSRPVPDTRRSHRAHRANHDVLTGLPNRVLFKQHLGIALSLSHHSRVPFSLICIHLERLHQINEMLGTGAGNRVLQEIARRLVAVTTEVHTLARLDTDEFVILSPGLSGTDAVEQFCLKLLDILRPAVQFDGRDLAVEARLGCAEYPRHGRDDVELLWHADAALRMARAGGSGYAIYSSPREAAGRAGVE